MTETFEKLKALLNATGTLTIDEIARAEGESGPLTDEERLWLSVEQHDRLKREGAEITLEQYVEAARTLETAPPDSAEYVQAQRIVEAFESAA